MKKVICRKNTELTVFCKAAREKKLIQKGLQGSNFFVGMNAFKIWPIQGKDNWPKIVIIILHYLMYSGSILISVYM